MIHSSCSCLCLCNVHYHYYLELIWTRLACLRPRNSTSKNEEDANACSFPAATVSFSSSVGFSAIAVKQRRMQRPLQMHRIYYLMRCVVCSAYFYLLFRLFFHSPNKLFVFCCFQLFCLTSHQTSRLTKPDPHN